MPCPVGEDVRSAAALPILPFMMPGYRHRNRANKACIHHGGEQGRYRVFCMSCSGLTRSMHLGGGGVQAGTCFVFAVWERETYSRYY